MICVLTFPCSVCAILMTQLLQYMYIDTIVLDKVVVDLTRCSLIWQGARWFDKVLVDLKGLIDKVIVNTHHILSLSSLF